MKDGFRIYFIGSFRQRRQSYPEVNIFRTHEPASILATVISLYRN